MTKKKSRQYNINGKWSDADVFDNIADLCVEVQDLWNCDEFSMELETWCENANIGDVFKDDDIRVTVCE